MLLLLTLIGIIVNFGIKLMAIMKTLACKILVLLFFMFCFLSFSGCSSSKKTKGRKVNSMDRMIIPKKGK